MEIHFFERTRETLSRICQIGADGSVFVDALTLNLLSKEGGQCSRQDEYRVVQEESIKFLDAIFESIQTGWQDPDFNTSAMYSALGVSKSQFYRKLKALVGYAPLKFILELRLKRAVELLKESDANVSEVSYQVGFNSSSYFTKVFKKRFGITPSSSI